MFAEFVSSEICTVLQEDACIILYDQPKITCRGAVDGFIVYILLQGGLIRGHPLRCLLALNERM